MTPLPMAKGEFIIHGNERVPDIMTGPLTNRRELRKGRGVTSYGDNAQRTSALRCLLCFQRFEHTLGPKPSYQIEHEGSNRGIPRWPLQESHGRASRGVRVPARALQTRY